MPRKRMKKQVERPNLEGLTPAVGTDGQFNVTEGQYVVIDRLHHNFNENVWKDTRVFQVFSVDRLTADVVMWDMVREQFAGTNYVTASQLGDNIYIFPDDRNPRGDISDLVSITLVPEDEGVEEEFLDE